MFDRSFGLSENTQDLLEFVSAQVCSAIIGVPSDDNRKGPVVLLNHSSSDDVGRLRAWHPLHPYFSRSVNDIQATFL